MKSLQREKEEKLSSEKQGERWRKFQSNDKSSHSLSGTHLCTQHFRNDFFRLFCFAISMATENWSDAFGTCWFCFCVFRIKSSRKCGERNKRIYGFYLLLFLYRTRRTLLRIIATIIARVYLLSTFFRFRLFVVIERMHMCNCVQSWSSLISHWWCCTIFNLRRQFLRFHFRSIFDRVKQQRECPRQVLRLSFVWVICIIFEITRGGIFSAFWVQWWI